MKTLLIKFFKSMTCKLMWAMVATASAAHAHDLPSDCPFAHDWDILQQDCMGVHDATASTVSPAELMAALGNELIVVAPEMGEPPIPVGPTQAFSSNNNSIIPSFDDFHPFDKIDCSILESQFRGYPLVEATEALRRTAAVESDAIADAASSEFDRLYYGARSCEFESSKSEQLLVTRRLAFDRTCVEDSIPLQFHTNRYRFMDYLNLDAKPLIIVDSAPLATATPVDQVREEHPHQLMLGQALSNIATWQCVCEAELFNCRIASEVGSQIASASSKWIGGTIPQLASQLNGLKFTEPVANQAPIRRPMFALYSLGNGETLAIPEEQAKQWKFAHAADRSLVPQSPMTSELAQASPSESVTLSPEFRAIMNQANVRLKWAGGRLSQAANMMNDWVSNRLARTADEESLR